MRPFEKVISKGTKGCQVSVCRDFVRPFGKINETEREDSDMMTEHEKPELEPASETCDGVTDEIPDGIVRELGDLPSGAIIEKEALARMFHCHSVSVKRAVERGELPPPTRLFGKSRWTAGAILDHVSKRLDAAQREAEKTAAKFLKFST